MPEHNPLHKLSEVLLELSHNNEAEQEAIGKYYELLKKIHCAKEEHRFYFDPEKSIMVDLEEMPDGEESEEMVEARRCYGVIKEYLMKVKKIVDEIISEEKKHSLLLNSLAIEIDGVMPEID